MSKDMVTMAQNTGLVPAVEMKEQVLALFDKGREGFEQGVDIDQLTIPRVKLLQGLSDEVKADPRNFIAGMLINSVTKETLTKNFIPLAKMPTSWIRFNPRDTKNPNFVPEFGPGAVVWRSSDPNDPRVLEQGKWGPNDEPPAATEYMNFLCYFEGFAIPLVLGFCKSSFKTGKDFFTMAFGFGGAMYTRKYDLTSVSKNKSGNDFFVLQVRSAGKCNEDELAIGKALFNTFGPKIKDLKVHEESEAPEGEDTAF